MNEDLGRILEQLVNLPRNKQNEMIARLKAEGVGNFFARKPEDVAKDLTGMFLVRVTDDSTTAGQIIDIDAWAEPVNDEKNAHYYTQEPGRIYMYTSRRGEMMAITAHEPGKAGLVRIKEIAVGKSVVTTTKVIPVFELDYTFDKKMINDERLYLAKPTVSLEQAGYSVRRIDPKEKGLWVAEYKLSRR